MDHNDRAAIDSLLRNLETAARSAPQPDAEAQHYIQSALAHQPNAPYFMLQTIAMQNQALENLQKRVTELEAGSVQRQQPRPAAPQAPAAQSAAPGGMFGRLFGGNAAPARPQAPAPQAAAPQSSGPWGQRQGGGGGFLAGAAQTAMGVAGGMLLGNALTSMFSQDAQAAEPSFQGDPSLQEEAYAPEEETFEDGAFDDSGFDDGGDWE